MAHRAARLHDGGLGILRDPGSLRVGFCTSAKDRALGVEEPLGQASLKCGHLGKLARLVVELQAGDGDRVEKPNLLSSQPGQECLDIRSEAHLGLRRGGRDRCDVIAHDQERFGFHGAVRLGVQADVAMNEA